MYSIDKLFNIAQNDILCNTSYPIRPSFFEQYKSSHDIMEHEYKMGFYIHVPFCERICKFCEYTRFKKDDDKTEKKYLTVLKKQIAKFITTHKISCLYGFDIGGGTPTSLSHENFEILMGIANELITKYPKINDFESSIEFNLATIDEDKIKAIHQAGLKRVSTGIQTYNKKILRKNNREFIEEKQIEKVNELLKKYGVEKLNIDVMYGLPQQTIEMCNDTMDVILRINPEQVTLYETRYNMNGMCNSGINRKMLFAQYCTLYHRLIEMGYTARFGQNTFTKTDDDGVSSYLKYRMNKGVAYKGFGVSAQSMSKIGISYNSLKASKEVYWPDIDEITEEDNYLLPPEEIAAKYVSIALYSAKFSLSTLSFLVKSPAKEYYAEIFDFLLNGDYIYICDDECFLTAKGFMYYGAIAALFWSGTHKEKYLSFRDNW